MAKREVRVLTRNTEKKKIGVRYQNKPAGRDQVE
jgi:hypothetical protein